MVCLLRDTDALITHAQNVMAGYGPATVLDAVLANIQTLNPMLSASFGDAHNENPYDSGCDSGDEPPFTVPERPVAQPPVTISSMGLW